MNMSSKIQSARKPIVLLTALLLLVSVANVQARQSAEPIWQSCHALGQQTAGETSDGGDKSSLCYQYIKGFLEGAVLTDTQIMAQLAQTNSKSAFAQRAIRTRVGNTRATDVDTYLAKFCLPDTHISHGIINEVATNLATDDEAQQQIGPLVYQAVKQAYPCDPS